MASNLYEVEAILLSRPLSIPKNGSIPRLEHLALYAKEYFVKWKGYSITESTWEPYANLKNVDAMVRAFVVRDEQALQSLPNYKNQIGLYPTFACEDLISKRTTADDRTEYLVKWKDFVTETWEDEGTVPAEAIEEFNRKHGDASDFGGATVHDNDEEEERTTTTRQTRGSSTKLKREDEEEHETPKRIKRKREQPEEEDEEETTSDSSKKRKLSSQDEEDVEMLKGGEWKIQKVAKVSDRIVIRVKNAKLGVRKVSVNAYREHDPQGLIDYFLTILK